MEKPEVRTPASWSCSMKPGDLVKYKNGNVYLINGKREIKGKVVYYFLDGFPDNEVFSPEDLELLSEAR